MVSTIKKKEKKETKENKKNATLKKITKTKTPNKTKTTSINNMYLNFIICSKIALLKK